MRAPIQSARPTPPDAARACAVLAAAVAGLGLVLAGCSKSSVVTPVPDCGGTHLLVFSSGRQLSSGQYNISLYDLDQLGFHALRDFGGAGADRRPAITVDGKIIAVERAHAGSGQDVLVYDRCAAAFLDRPELNSSGDETDPTFSADTYKLAFARDTLGQPRLRLYDGLTRRFLKMPLLETLASGGADAFDPTLDRTARLVAFCTTVAGKGNLLVYDRGVDTLLATPLLNTADDERDPWITPDARYLAFASDRAGGVGGFDIYLYDLLNRAYVVTDSLNSTEDDRHPTTSGDAVFMVFQSNRLGALAKGKWDLYNYNRNGHTVGQSFQESSSEDDVEPGIAWP